MVPPRNPPKRPSNALDLGGLYLAEFRHVAQILGLLGVPKDDLEDVAQDAFLKALRFASTFDAARPSRPWLLAIARRTAIDHLRHSLHEVRTSLSPMIDDPNPALLATDLVAAGIRQVEPALRVIFDLHAAQGFTIPEVATILGLSLPTAYARYRLARMEFIEALGPILDP
jgi:RNA polymerase sigma-70 factor (ECF subfamily)